MDDSVLGAITFGTVVGLSAGLAPGPLLALVVTQTLQYNVREGVKVALAPLITDIPIVLLTLLVLSQFQHSGGVLAVVSFVGGLYVLVLGIESLRTHSVEVGDETSVAHSVRKGAVVNALNPHPYVFWLTVGAPYLLKTGRESVLAAGAFAACFYLNLVGAKLLLAVLTGKTRRFMTGSTYVWAMRILGVLLLLFGLALLIEATTLLSGTASPSPGI